MNLPVIMLGAGGHAKVLIDTLQLSGRHIVGIADNDISRHSETILGVPVIGGDEAVFSHPPAGVALVNGLGSVKSTEAREKLFFKFKKAGYFFANVIHSTATVSSYAQVGEGAQIMAGAVVQTGCTIGINSIINTRASVDHDCRIGDHAHIAPGATLSGNVDVGDNVHIGTGAVVIQGIKIGRGSTVAAGAVVVRDVPPAAIVKGVPGRAGKK